MEELEHFTWGGKGVTRSFDKVAWEGGTWKSPYKNTNTVLLLYVIQQMIHKYFLQNLFLHYFDTHILKFLK